MTQNAVVTKLISRHVAEVEVERGTACGGTCESCEACVFQSRIRAEALNKVSALPGQKVVIESKTSDVLGAAALLYLVPFVLLFLGYAIGSALGWGRLRADRFCVFRARRGVQCCIPAPQESEPHYI